MRRRVLVVGLDCLDPRLAFGRFAADMPNLSRLRARGRWGPLRSTTPPITVPAWATMTSGLSPGALGLYGFRNRRGWSYEMEIATSRSVRAPRLWDLLSDAGKRVIVQGVPPTYPPSPVHGDLVSCFLTPKADRTFTHPASLRDEIESRFGVYRHDVEDFRTDARDRVLAELYETTDQHFEVARHLLSTRDWDFFMMVEMGPDRLHHAFWRFMDPDDPRHVAHGPWKDAGQRYYAHVDELLGSLLERTDDETTVLVVSDHGARPMRGGIHVNEWLRREGHLALFEAPRTPSRLEPSRVDWGKTRAWAEGGYYARIFLNVRGREPQGTIAPEDREKVRSEIAAAIAAIADPEGRPLGTIVKRPEETYEVVTGHPPDLLVFFGDLAWRALGTVGTPGIHASENDAGPDGANHDWDGVFVLAGAAVQGGGPLAAGIADVTPTVLAAFGVDPPSGIVGRSRLD